MLPPSAACQACHFSTSELEKIVEACCALYILTCKCASCYSSVQFFHIPTSKSGPNLLCFVHFDLQMCFSLQRRAIFHFSSKQLPPHPPLYQAYFSTQPTHKPVKKQHFATSLTFRASVSAFVRFLRTCFFFLLTLLLFPAFHLLTLLLCPAFPTVHIVGS